jgi:hypothetical protein
MWGQPVRVKRPLGRKEGDVRIVGTTRNEEGKMGAGLVICGSIGQVDVRDVLKSGPQE